MRAGPSPAASRAGDGLCGPDTWRKDVGKTTHCEKAFDREEGLPQETCVDNLQAGKAKDRGACGRLTETNQETRTQTVAGRLCHGAASRRGRGSGRGGGAAAALDENPERSDRAARD